MGGAGEPQVRRVQEAGRARQAQQSNSLYV